MPRTGRSDHNQRQANTNARKMGGKRWKKKIALIVEGLYIPSQNPPVSVAVTRGTGTVTVVLKRSRKTSKRMQIPVSCGQGGSKINEGSSYVKTRVMVVSITISSSVPANVRFKSLPSWRLFHLFWFTSFVACVVTWRLAHESKMSR